MNTHCTTTLLQALSLQLLVDKDFSAVIAQKTRNSVKQIGLSALKQRGFVPAGATIVLHIEINKKILMYDHMLFYYEFLCHAFKLCAYHISICGDNSESNVEKSALQNSLSYQ